MACKITSVEAATTIGIDIGKNTFHLIGLDKKGAIVLRQRLSRKQVDSRLANMPPCLIGMEACVGAHHLGRHLKAFGHFFPVPEVILRSPAGQVMGRSTVATSTP